MYLSKPSHGWSYIILNELSGRECAYRFSYVRDTPQDIIYALESALRKMFTTPSASFSIDAEGWETFFVVDDHVTYVFSDAYDDNIMSVKRFYIGIEDFTQKFIESIEKHADEWASWQVMNETDAVRYYDLSELKEILKWRKDNVGRSGEFSKHT